jgi:hypothetical protein
VSRGDGLVPPGAAVVAEASVESADMSAGGNSRPRFAARRRMPVAARADRKNLGGTVSDRIEASVEGDDEHSPSTLRHSEVASVENPVGPPVPEFAQATDERPKVAAGMTGEEARYVLEDDRGRSVSLHKVEEGEGEAGSLAREPLALPGDAEVLAGEAAGPEVGAGPVRIDTLPMPWPPVPTLIAGESVPTCSDREPPVVWNASGEPNDASEVGDSGPVSGEDG